MRNFQYILIIIIVFGCKDFRNKINSEEKFLTDSIAVFRQIKKGDSIYSAKSDYLTFVKSLTHYDTASQIAISNGDTSLIAATIFAKGRAFDAINNNAQKTIDYYTTAANLYTTLPGQEVKALYIKHLVAHAYDKARDSTNCVNTLIQLYNDIKNKPDSTRKKMGFIAEMALISTVVKNYSLADSILNNLTKREWIKNDSTEYDYLNHYYLTKAKINSSIQKNGQQHYIDSVVYILKIAKNASDSIYYCNELYELYKSTNQSEKATFYNNLNKKIFDQFNSPNVVRLANDKISKLEVAALETEKQAEKEKTKQKEKYLYTTLGLLSTITILSIFLYKRNREIRKKQKAVELANQNLAEKNMQNELLHKELHHRVKNNLQMIMSLVYLQERKSGTEDGQQNLQEIRLRIESIAALHEQMLPENNHNINLKKYISAIISSITSLIGTNRKIMAYLEIEEIQITPQQGFALGLLVNEWITNSAKYAIVESDSLHINLTIKKQENFIEVIYFDNGHKQHLTNINKGLGSRIIELLITQLHAKANVNDADIFHYNIKIPISEGPFN